MIKNYLELSEIDLEKFIEFKNRNKEEKLPFEELDKIFKSDEFDFGKGVIIKMNEKHIEGNVSIVLKECDKKGIAYIVRLDINEDVENKKLVTQEIIEASKDIAKKYGANKAFMGTENTEIIDILNSLNRNKQYSMVEMILEDRVHRYTPFNLVALSENNKREYLSIYNDAFYDVPNGATVTENEVEDYIKNANEKNSYYIVLINNEMAGFIQFNIVDNTGEFDLGLAKAARGQGFGKQLLETAISFLNSKKVEQIKLMVATKNILAYELYKKRGFIEYKIHSDWFELF
jgi:ribosomal protein S18 acetylase RimI-like enzyme